jgi:pimeloyl-ACP methyl ester carboxylesterase
MLRTSQEPTAPVSDTPSPPTSLSADDDVPRVEQEPCPTPLEWHEVLRAFVEEPEHWSFEHKGIGVRGRTWGSGTPLYFLNGVCGTHELFALLVHLLREDHRCVLFDYPESRDGRPASLAEWIPRIAEQHRDERVLLFAPGFGSLVGFEAAARFPEYVSALVCPAASAGTRLAPGERLLGHLGRCIPGRFRRVPGKWHLQQRSHRVWFPPYDASRFEFYVQNTGENRTRAVASRFLAGATFRPDRLESIQQPVLLVRSEGDGPVQQAAMEELAARLPHVSIEWLHTTGLLSYLTHPHRVAKLIRTFSASLDLAQNRG